MVNVSICDIARTVFVFLGIPFIAGIVTRFVLIRRKGKAWYEGTFMYELGLTALVGLLFAIVVMFSLKGEYILPLPWDVVWMALPVVSYFLMSWVLKFTRDGDALIHSGKQQLRTCHGGGGRGLRNQLGRSFRYCDRAALRSPGID